MGKNKIDDLINEVDLSAAVDTLQRIEKTTEKAGEKLANEVVHTASPSGTSSPEAKASDDVEKIQKDTVKLALEETHKTTSAIFHCWGKGDKSWERER